MVCLILAAGYATRLYPLTENFPKPLLPVGGKPILDWLIEDIEQAGVEEYVVITNHKFASHFHTWAEGKRQRITVLDDGTESNETRLGAVRDMQLALDTLPIEDDLLVIAGDNLLDFSLVTFLQYAREKGSSCVMRYAEKNSERLKKCGVLTVDGQDRVLSMVEKPQDPPSLWCCPPFYYYTRQNARRISEGIAAGCGTDAPGSFVAWLAEREPLYAMEMPGARYDIGNLESYAAVCRHYKGVK